MLDSGRSLCYRSLQIDRPSPIESAFRPRLSGLQKTIVTLPAAPISIGSGISVTCAATLWGGDQIKDSESCGLNSNKAAGCRQPLTLLRASKVVKVPHRKIFDKR